MPQGLLPGVRDALAGQPAPPKARGCDKGSARRREPLCGSISPSWDARATPRSLLCSASTTASCKGRTEAKARRIASTGSERSSSGGGSRAGSVTFSGRFVEGDSHAVDPSPLQRDVERQLSGRSAHLDERLASRFVQLAESRVVPVRSTYPPLLWQIGLELELDHRRRTGISSACKKPAGIGSTLSSGSSAEIGLVDRDLISPQCQLDQVIAGGAARGRTDSQAHLRFPPPPAQVRER